MLYKHIKRAVLSHIDQYTVAGAEVVPTYNNQADYENRIPVFFNEGLMNILTTVKPQAVLFALQRGQQMGGMTIYELPVDFWSLKSGGVFVVRAGRFEKTNGRESCAVRFQRMDTQWR